MGRYKNGINGAFSGKVGKVIGASNRGVDYMRGLAEPSKKPPTLAQKNQRLKMSIISGWLRPLLDLVNIGYQCFKGSITPMNGCISYHMKNVLTGEGPEYEIDYAKAIFSRGELLISSIKEVTQMAESKLRIKWESTSASLFCAAADQVNFIFYNPDKQQFISFERVAVRSDRKAVLRFPPDFMGNLIHGWMGYVNETSDAVSTSVYLGEVVI